MMLPVHGPSLASRPVGVGGRYGLSQRGGHVRCVDCSFKAGAIVFAMMCVFLLCEGALQEDHQNIHAVRTRNGTYADEHHHVHHT